jgi:PAS domain S-box-containing protein
MMPLTDDDNEPIGFLKILRDRTVQRTAQQALEESEMRTRLALEAGGLGAWQSSPGLRELKWDARTRELLGHDPDEPLDYEHSFLARVHPDDRERIAAINTAALGPTGDGITEMEYRTISAIDGKERWIHAKGALVIANDDEQRFVGTVRDITAEKASEAHRRLLVDELQHRVKNTLAVVQSIVGQSLRNVATPEEARDAIVQRLVTLAHAHDLLVQTSWTDAPMAAIAEGATRLQGHSSSRIAIAGPEIKLSAKAALAFSMTLHELMTNAAKYGALANQTGTVDLTWAVKGSGDDATLVLHWREHGGPPVTPPAKKGFGTRLMSSLAGDLGGLGELVFDAQGVSWTLQSKLNEIIAAV